MITVILEGIEPDLEEIYARIHKTYQPYSFEVRDVNISVETTVFHKKIQSRNVLAYLAGSQPTSQEEIVIVGAHFDHIGVQEGKIYNGADDDASGIAGLLEIAQAFALSPQKPKRSILFAAWNAEEPGLLGSFYYVNEPNFPMKKTVAMFQMDMIGRNEEVLDPSDSRFQNLEKQSAEQNTNSVNVLGYSRSQQLRQLVSKVNRRIGLDLKFRYDNHPLNLLRRSDHWPFLNKGVPTLFFHTGLHPDYHQPSDTPDKINYDKLEKIVRLVFLCTWRTTNTLSLPTRLRQNSADML